MLSSLITISLLRKGIGLDIRKCDEVDLALQGALVFVAILCTVLGALIVLREDRIKRKNGYNFI